MPALPPLYALQAFLAAADCGSFTGAATRLNLTQGAVSRQVQLLEEYYECPLFVRQARGLTLTAEGQELLAPVRQALQTLSEASARVRRGSDVLRIQFPPTMAVRWFLPRLPALQAEEGRMHHPPRAEQRHNAPHIARGQQSQVFVDDGDVCQCVRADNHGVGCLLDLNRGPW